MRAKFRTVAATVAATVASRVDGRRTAVLALAAVLGGAIAFAAPLPAVVPPAENQPGEAKRVLGKILFWDEQVSSDDTVACGTCHLPKSGGTDPRSARHPGADGTLGTADDPFGSPGVVHRDASRNFEPHVVFGLGRQVTEYKAPSSLSGALVGELFWNGRAAGRFVDPQTSAVSVVSGGALESQAVGPPLSATEMGHEGRTWDDVVTKLRDASPLALATDLPADVAAVLATDPSYPALFAAAFGDPAITAERFAFAIATYERTLVPDQTPWDRFNAGDTSALTAQQQRGWTSFQTVHCNDCHKAPAFTDGTFRNIGFRPVSEDSGRQEVTGLVADRGKFKVPSLRGIGQQSRFMRNGRISTLADVMRFYARAPGTTQFTDNRDPLIPQINLPPNVAGDIEAFLATGLTDPRAAAGSFPFDRPTLASEVAARSPLVSGAGRAGSGGGVPQMTATMPPYLGNDEFRLGVDSALGGAQAWVALSGTQPTGAEVFPETLLGPVVLAGSAPGAGFGTMAWPVPDDRSMDGRRVWFQWRVADPSAAGGVALSPIASVTLFAVKSTAAPAAVVVDASDLFLGSATFVVDWKRHAADADADAFAAAGSLGASSGRGFAGADFSVLLGGSEIVHATLDASGRAATPKGSSPSVSVRTDAAGRFTVAASGLDLRDRIGLASTAGSGRLLRDVRVVVTSPGSEPVAVEATVPFSWTTVEDRASRGTFRYARDGLTDGVFSATAATARVRRDASVSLRVAGALDAADGGAFAPDGDVTVRIGAVTVVLPKASVALGRDGSLRAASAAASGPTVRLTRNADSRRFVLVCEGLDGGVLPSGDALAADVAVSIACTVAGRDTVSRTTLALRRKSATATVWTQ